MSEQDPMYLHGEHAAERLIRAQKLQAGSPYLEGEDPPSLMQISAVLNALADHGLQAHMNSEVVLALGDDRAHLGGTWRQDAAHGRFFQRMGRYLEALDWQGHVAAAEGVGADE